MKNRRIGIASAVGLLGVVLFASIALADTTLEDGDYTLTLPGVGVFEFTVATGGTEVTTVVAAPIGYEIDDDDLAKVAWKDAASLEVEAKTDKVEADYDWAGGDANLALPGGGSITVTEPDAEGAFTVSASGGWYHFGGGSDWFVANNAVISLADKFFKVEATADGVEIKPVDAPNDGFLNDLEEEEEEEVEVEVEAEESGGEGRGKGRGKRSSA